MFPQATGQAARRAEPAPRRCPLVPTAAGLLIALPAAVGRALRAAVTGHRTSVPYEPAGQL